uniref:DUF148 domain-containing protein n=1 Tax=Parastrongyloides trichosuri TaxID=131310 RepID=A0A0N4ZLQ0_PARTI
MNLNLLYFIVNSLDKDCNMNVGFIFPFILIAIPSVVQMQYFETTSINNSIERDGPFGGPSPCSPPIGSKEQFKMGKHFGKHRMPPFLEGLSSEEKNQFLDIMKNKNLTKKEIHDLEDDWADKQSEDIRKAYNEFKANRTSHIAEMKDRVKSKVSSLPTFLQDTASKIESLLDNQNISRSYERKVIEDIFKNLTNHQKEVMKSVFPIPLLEELTNKERCIKIGKPNHEISEEE